MATQTLSTQWGLDVSQYLSGAQQQITAMGNQNQGLEGLISTAVKFNESQKQIAVTLNQTVSAVDKMTTRLRALKKEEVEILALGGKVTGKVPGQDLVVDSVTVRTKAPTGPTPEDIAKGFSAREQVQQQFPAPANATIGQLGKYESALARVQKLVESGKVSQQRFAEIMNAVGTGGLAKLKLTGDEAKLVTAIGQIKDGFSEAEKEGNKFHLSMRNIFRIAEALVLKEVIGALVSQFQKATFEAIAFQIKLSEIRTLSTDNQSSFEAWSASIARVSDSFGIPQIEVAKAAYEALSAQVTEGKDQTERFTASAARLARVGVSDIGEAGKLLASVFNAYNISAERADEVSAKLFVAVDRGNFTVKDLAGNFGRVETTAATIGVTFDELLAAMTTLTRQGVNAADAQTQLSNVFLKLLNPTGATTKLLRSLGFETGQAAISALGFVGVLQQIEKATRGDAGALADFGGEMRAIRGLIGLTTRGKGGEFAEDLALIKNSSKERFDEADKIRGESAGDKLTIQLNKMKNFFTNELGQGALNSLVKLTDGIGGIADAVKLVTVTLVQGGKVLGLYILTTKAAATSSALFATVLNRNLVAGSEAANAAMAKNAKTAAVLGTAISVVGGAIIAAFVIDEIAKFRREMNGLNKETEDYQNALKRIEAARAGKDEGGASLGHKLFTETALARSADFGNFLDKLFQPLLKEQSDTARAATRDLDYLKDKGKEAALGLTEAFKRTGDSVHGLIKNFEEAFTKARQEVEKSKKSVLSFKELGQSLKFDLDFEFANPQQKFQLRDQEIQRMTQEAKKLLSSNNNEDIDKGRALAQEVLKKVKEDASERVKFQQDQDAARLAAQGPRAGVTNTAFAFTAEQKDRLDSFVKLFQDFEADIQRRKKEEEAQNEKLIRQEKDRLRQLEDRVKLFEQLKLFDGDKINPEFANERGKLDENKFNKEFEKRSKAITDLLQTEEEKNLLLPQLEKARVNLLRQQTAEIRLQEVLTKQLQAGQIKSTSKDEFEKATQNKIKASEGSETAGRELNAASGIINKFLNRAGSDNQFSTIGQDENSVKRVMQQIFRSVADAQDSVSRGLGREPLALTERQRKFQENEGLIKSIVDTQAEIEANKQKLLQRNARGELIDDPNARQNLRLLTGSLIEKMNLLIGAFTGQKDNKNFAAPGGATLGELQKQMLDALKIFDNAGKANAQADAVLKNLEDQLAKIFTPAQIAAAKQSAVTETLTGATIRAATATENLVREFKNLPALAPPQPSNIPLNMSQIQGKHFGGLLTGPKGYDNLLIRAEAGEFMVNQEATRKWLPQLIEMNSGRTPKMKGRYHEGGLVQTTVGDVNVTITGPVSPERNVRQIGKAIRRQIRMGQLDLSPRK